MFEFSNLPRRRRCRAVTLIEAVLYISIALALIVGGLVFFQQASLASRVNEQVRVLSALVAEARSHYTSQPSAFAELIIYGGDPEVFLLGFPGERVDSVLVAAGAVPTIAVASPPIAGSPYPAVLRTTWGGAIRMVGAKRGPNLELMIGLSQIPRQACARLASVSRTGQGVFSDGISMVGFVRKPPTVGYFLDVFDPSSDLSMGNIASNSVLCGGTNPTMDLWFLVSLK